jgi:hypothetical protein
MLYGTTTSTSGISGFGGSTASDMSSGGMGGGGMGGGGMDSGMGGGMSQTTFKVWFNVTLATR